MKTNRNAPCPCGSGKKYKRCCLPREAALNFKPHPEPQIINHHLVLRDGVWHKRPGRIKATVYYKAEEDVDGRIEQLFQPVFSVTGSPEDAALINRLHDCKHKIYAVRWHTKTIIDAIEKQARELQSRAGRFSGVTAERFNPEVIYLTENFLFQVVSSIEVLTQALHHVIPCLSSYVHDPRSHRKRFLEGKKLVARLSENGEKALANYLKSVWDGWLEELTEMRNTVTHVSALNDLRCFQEDPYNGESIVIQYPRLPSGQQVHDYCEEIFANVMQVHAKILAYVHEVLSNSPRKTSPFVRDDLGNEGASDLR